MSFDLVDRFKELSVSSFGSVALNKKPFILECNPEEFYSYDHFKYSSRILLNYKDLSLMGLKAGSYVRIFSEENSISRNLYEVWPSILTKSLVVTVASSSTLDAFKNSKEIFLSSINFITQPIQKALKVRITYLNLDSSKHTELLLEWLNHNVFLGNFSSYIFHEEKEVHFRLEVIEGSSDKVYKFVQNQTVFEEHHTAAEPETSKIGGLKSQYEELLKFLKVLLKSNDVLNIRTIKLPHGVLLHGPPGCGKTLLVKAVSEAVNVPVFQLTASDFSSTGFGEAEVKLKHLFNSAKNASPCIFFMDEIDSLCPKRDNASNASSNRITTLLLTLMDGCVNSLSQTKVFFIGATNMVSSLDPALRRPGRFDREIEISPPSIKDRFDILKTILEKYPTSLSNSDIESISESSHGFVGSDLNLLCKEAFIVAIKKLKSESNFAEIKSEDMNLAFLKVRPSAMREVFVEVPKVKWSDIGGQKLTKQKLIECIEWPIKYPDRFKRLGINPPRGVLLFGPPGCSKTLLAKALASESGLNFLAVKGPEIFSKYIGDSEKKIRDVFKKARQASPSIIFFDEFDSIAGRGEDNGNSSSVTNRVMSQLLNEMDGLEPLVNVIIIAATNKPDLIDKALLRPGRFDRHIYISLPDFDGRLEIFKILMQRMPFSNEFDLEIVANLTEGFSGAEITSLCQNAAIRSLETAIDNVEIKWSDFEYCLHKFVKQISIESLKVFEKFIE